MAIQLLENYAEGKWVQGQGEGQTLFNASTGEALYSASSKGLDFGAMMQYGRTKGREKLAKMGFHDRGLMLKKLAMHLQSKKRNFYKISFHTIAAGSLVSLLMNIMPYSSYNLTPLFILSIVLAGLIATSRLILKAHEPKEVYMGLLAGYFAMFFSYQVYGKLMEMVGLA